jgi:hypothetical protein
VQQKDKRPEISNECLFGFCNRCSDPDHCKHSCGHKKPVSELQALANEYNKLARAKQLRPGYLNMDKVDHRTLYKAAETATAANQPELSLKLRTEARKRKDAAFVKRTATQEDGADVRTRSIAQEPVEK